MATIFFPVDFVFKYNISKLFSKIIMMLTDTAALKCTTVVALNTN